MLSVVVTGARAFFLVQLREGVSRSRTHQFSFFICSASLWTEVGLPRLVGRDSAVNRGGQQGEWV